METFQELPEFKDKDDAIKFLKERLEYYENQAGYHAFHDEKDKQEYCDIICIALNGTIKEMEEED
jgi:hypothetical protein